MHRPLQIPARRSIRLPACRSAPSEPSKKPPPSVGRKELARADRQTTANEPFKAPPTRRGLCRSRALRLRLKRTGDASMSSDQQQAPLSVGIVGATGMVGELMRSILAE